LDLELSDAESSAASTMLPEDHTDGAGSVPCEMPEDLRSLPPFALAAQVSAQACEHGGLELFEERVKALGPDPLREDAKREDFEAACKKTRRAIGLVLMDQSCISGVGNIFRAEILYKARVHPAEVACELSGEQIDAIWHHSVELLQWGFQLGSIITTSKADRSKRRRYIYNMKTCLCGAGVRCWKMAGRTAYACERCQPPPQATATEPVVPFTSTCAPEIGSASTTPSAMKVAELRKALAEIDMPTSGTKAELIARLESGSTAREINSGSHDSPARTRKRISGPSSSEKS